MEKEKELLALKDEKKIEFVDIINFVIPLLIFVISLLSFFPGIITSDCLDQINQALTNNYYNAHPIIHSMFIGLLTKIGGQGAIWIPALVQIVFFSTSWSYICKCLRKYNNSRINKFYQIIISVIVSMLPINFMYAITLWKDIIYSYNFILLVGLIYIGIKEKFNYSKSQIILISLSSVAIMKFRLNGFPVGLLTFIILFVLNVKFNNNKNSMKIFIISFIICYLIFTIPVKFVHVINHKTESKANVLTSTEVYSFGAILNSDAKIDEEDKEFLNSIYNLDDWKNYYDAYSGSQILFDEKYTNNVIWNDIDNIKKFDAIYMKYAKRYPKVLIKHFVEVNSIWWSVKEKGGLHSIVLSNDWIAEQSNHIYDNKPIWQLGYNILIKIINKSLSSVFYYLIYRPAFALIISFIIIIAISLNRKDGWMFLIIVPAILNIGTYIILISSQDERYFYPTQITSYVLLLIFGVEFLKTKKYKKCNLEKEKS